MKKKSIRGRVRSAWVLCLPESEDMGDLTSKHALASHNMYGDHEKNTASSDTIQSGDRIYINKETRRREEDLFA